MRSQPLLTRYQHETKSSTLELEKIRSSQSREIFSLQITHHLILFIAKRVGRPCNLNLAPRGFASYLIFGINGLIFGVQSKGKRLGVAIETDN